ncbi:MAG: RecX family transcriptional regulator [Proteobacteria bacterium]|nr:RecX family transcriptional regulator [Pseudomonadota bacterium]
MREKLKDRFGEIENLEKIINWLKRLGALDDEKNREYFLNKLRERGYGAKYIKLSLKKRGFDTNIDIVDTQEDIEKWFKKKVKDAKKPFNRKEIARVFRYLLSKGFSSEEVYSFLKKEGIYEGERD